MKRNVAALFLAIAGTLPLSAQDFPPASSVMPPGYLQSMPAADRLLADMKVADSVETRARRYAAVSHLRDILTVLTWDHIYVRTGDNQIRSGLTPAESSLNRGYLDAENQLRWGSGTVPGLSALMDRYSAAPFRRELLDRYFSSAWKAAFLARDAQYRVRVRGETPAMVQAEQQASPATVQAEQWAPYSADLRCTSGAAGARGKPVSGLEKEACDMAMAEIGKHWAKRPDGWITVLSDETGFAPIVFVRQVRSLAVERVRTHELSAADKMNGFEWVGEVSFSMAPMREEGGPGLVSGSTVSVMRREGLWSQWVDYQPPALRVQRVKGKWEAGPNSLLEGKLPMPPSAIPPAPGGSETVAMKSFLRALVSAEEAYFADSSRYTNRVADLFRLRLPGGMTLTSLSVRPGGWTAILESSRLPGTQCGIGINTQNPVLSSARDGEPACR